MRDCILIGIGEYYTSIIGPSLQKLEQEGVVRVTTLVDIHEQLQYPQFFPDAQYRKRKKNQLLSDLLSDLQQNHPIVILGHVHELHTPDAVDLTSHGFSVLLEKPFFINREQEKQLSLLLQQTVSKVGLMEYYLMMKSVPLLYALGLVQDYAFYKDLFIFGEYQHRASFSESIGEIRAIHVDVLEGEGDTGRVDHRGPHLVDVRKGGGMIDDLGVHACAPLFALESIIGKIDLSLGEGHVRTAYSQEYVQMAREKYALKDEYIGESFAQIDTQTDIGIPVVIRVGKYTPDNKNRRGIVIEGTKGTIDMDLSECALSINQKRVITLPKVKETKYYPVVRAAIETIQGNNPFRFDPFLVSFKIQQFIQRIKERRELITEKNYYKTGQDPNTIL